MNIIHNKDKNIIETEINGQTAYVKYTISNKSLDVRHTLVPKELEGRGIASELVRYAYDYAQTEGLHPVATCPYAVIWLKRHPEYNGTENSSEHKNTCSI